MIPRMTRSKEFTAKYSSYNKLRGAIYLGNDYKESQLKTQLLGCTGGDHSTDQNILIITGSSTSQAVLQKKRVHNMNRLRP